MEAKEISKKEDNNDLATFEEKENEFMKKIPWYCMGIIVVIFVGITIFLGGVNELMVLILAGSLGGVWIGYYVIGGVIGRILYRKYLKLQASNKNIRAYSGVYAFILVVSMIGIIGIFSVDVVYDYHNSFDLLLLLLLVAVVVSVLGGVLGGILGGLFGGMLGGGGEILIWRMIFELFFHDDLNDNYSIPLEVSLVGILVLGVVLMLIRAKTLGYKGLIGHTNMSTSIQMGSQLGIMMTSIPFMYFFVLVAFLSQQ